MKLPVPVVSKLGKPLMPTSPAKARRLVKSGEATPFYRLGVFCIRLNIDSNENVQSVVVGIDPGSKKEAFTVKSAHNTLLNIQSDAVSWVKDNIEAKANMRRGRRFRKTPCRKPRWANRRNSKRTDRIPPSTKARYDVKLGILAKIGSIYPINGIIVEDLKAVSKKGKKRWNVSFSPLEVGKKYFYSQIKKSCKLQLRTGLFTSRLRKELALSKTKNKMAERFDAHCVDSWVLANSVVGGHSKPDLEKIVYLKPYKASRRQLHYFQYGKGKLRSRFGGTRSLGLKKGSIIKYIGKSKSQIDTGGYYLVGGFNNKGHITLCSLGNQSNRLNRSINIKDCRHVAYNRFSIRT